MSRTCHLTAASLYSGEEIIAGDNEHFRVLELVPIEEEGSPFVGLLQVDAA